jgi:hypothetical protein
MNAGRFVGASVAVFVVRFLLNFGYYGYAMQARFKALDAAHPGVFREVIPAYALLDLLSALLITFLFVKAGSAFGGGVKGGAVLGLLIALIAPVIGALYWFFSVTFYPADLVSFEVVYQLVAHAIQGAVAGAIYKSS